jgi:putative ABC transport system permease protein
LLTRPLRTALALIGLSIPILGVLGLFSLSGGLKAMVGETLSQVEGVMILRENSPSPVFSDLEADTADKLRKIPGVAHVAPEVWKIALNIEGRLLLPGLSSKGIGSLLDQPVVQGQDIPAHQHLHTAIYPKNLKEGRFLKIEDIGKPRIVISRKIARDYPKAQGKPRSLGDTLKIGGVPFTIIGIYETGSMLLDTVIVMDIGEARKIFSVSPDTVSSIYVEANEVAKNKEISSVIESKIPHIEARSMTEFMANFDAMMDQLNTFLMMTVSLALVVGVVGIINTMLMSTSERFVEFGVLRTNGWSQSNILALVTLESAYLGLLAGVAGCALAIVGAGVANQFLAGGMHLSLPPSLFALGLGLSVVTGTFGGLYPAWRAARLVPMDAIRLGSH